MLAHYFQIRSLCLKSLSLINYPSGNKSLSSDEFLGFFETTPITHLHLYGHWQSVVDGTVLRSIMLRRNLEGLSLPADIPLCWATIARIQNVGSDGLFPALRFLKVAAEAKVLRVLLPKLHHLQGAALSQVDPPVNRRDHIIGSLCRCPQLEMIRFESLHTTFISAKELSALASGCPLLRKLDLNDTIQSDYSVTDELIETLASKWRDLANHSLQLEVNLSVGSLVSLARHCPRLGILHLMTDLDLNQLAKESKDIIFPSLFIHRLGRISPSAVETSQDVENVHGLLFSLLDDRFPGVRRFDFTLGADEDFDQLFQDEISEYLTEHTGHSSFRLLDQCLTG